MPGRDDNQQMFRDQTTRAWLMVTALAAVFVITLAACGEADTGIPEVNSPAGATTSGEDIEPARATSPSVATAPGPIEVEGVVIDVVGTLQAYDSFTLITDAGERITLVPMDDLLFDGGPLSHIHDHLVSGSKVRVVYTIAADGTTTAIAIGDAS